MASLGLPASALVALWFGNLARCRMEEGAYLQPSLFLSCVLSVQTSLRDLLTSKELPGVKTRNCVT